MISAFSACEGAAGVSDVLRDEVHRPLRHGVMPKPLRHEHRRVLLEVEGKVVWILNVLVNANTTMEKQK